MHIQSYIQGHILSYIKQSYQMLLLIVIIDLIPLFGVLYLDWGTMDAVYLYFFETLIICIITYLKMRRSQNFLIVTQHQKKENNTTHKTENRLMKLVNKSFRFVRWLVSIAFLLVNIPLCLLLLMAMLAIEGKGFSIFSVLGYDGGHTDLFVIDVNTFYIFVALLLFEHFYSYFAKYVGDKEYENAGLINEAIAFEIRVVIQSIVMIGGVALIYFFDFSKVMVIILILLKTLIDVFIYLRNRYWSNFVEWANDKYKVIGMK